MPDAARNDREVAGGQPPLDCRSVSFEYENKFTFELDDQLLAIGVSFPTGPIGIALDQTDEASRWQRLNAVLPERFIDFDRKTAIVECQLDEMIAQDKDGRCGVAHVAAPRSA